MPKFRDFRFPGLIVVYLKKKSRDFSRFLMNQLCAKNTSTASRICIKKSLFWGDSWVWFHFLLLFLGFKPLWTDIRYKDQTQLINLAIVRIKEEQDFIDNTIMKFVEVLNDSGVLNQDLYLQIKYGTSNRYEILLIQNGISLSLAKLLLDKYRKFIKFNSKVNG